MKDAARLLGYLVATVVVGALLAPLLFWAAQWAAANHVLAFLAGYEFEKFFHRALLIAAVVLLWPLLRSLKIKGARDLSLVPNEHRGRDLGAGFLLALLPLLCCGAALLGQHAYVIRNNVRWAGSGTLVLATIFVPLIEELFFRGFILGVLQRCWKAVSALIITSAFFAIIHFLKSPEDQTGPVTWMSGFISITHSFDQFHDPLLVLAGFTTLFVLGCILADTRIRTRSLALPIGLHAGWIFGAGIFNIIARGGAVGLPWIGKSLLVGIAPLSVALLTWALVRAWLHHVASRES